MWSRKATHFNQMGEPEHSLLQTQSPCLGYLKAATLCVCEKMGDAALFWQLCHPETPLQAESHTEVAEEQFS